MSPFKDVIWNRKIDLIEGHRAKIVSKSGAVYIGYSAFPCVGEDENDEEVDAICFDIDDGSSITLTENDIKKLRNTGLSGIICSLFLML